MSGVAAVAVVAVMHEQVHQRTGQQRKKDERAEQMSPMLHPKIHASDGEETDQDQPRSRGQKGFVRNVAAVRSRRRLQGIQVLLHSRAALHHAHGHAHGTQDDTVRDLLLVVGEHAV